jgi:hypothetical protein
MKFARNAPSSLWVRIQYVLSSFWLMQVHGGNPSDHFVHRFTHRVVRGVLIAVGRPDGSMQSQTTTEAYVLLALLQVKD